MLNSVGLQNPGAEAVVNEYFPKLKKVYRKKVFANVGGHDVVSYMKAAEILSRDDIVCALELNISCPNVKEGGMAFGTDPGKAAEITAAVKSVSEKPVFVKLSPNVTSVVDVALAVAAAGADGITLINTLLGMAVDRKTGRAITAVPHAGLSGAAVKPVALRMVHEVAGAVDLPIIGMGGIESAWDVIEFMSVGASAVMVGSKNLTDPFICKKIIEELPGVLSEIGVSDIKSIIGEDGQMREVIIACDFKDRSGLDALLKELKGERPYLKIGMEMYYRYGYELVRKLKDEGYKIFLDLKLHDIPNTVEAAARVIAELKTDMLNVHAAGGREMMRRASQAVREISPDTKVIAVTQLTSTSPQCCARSC